MTGGIYEESGMGRLRQGIGWSSGKPPEAAERRKGKARAPLYECTSQNAAGVVEVISVMTAPGLVTYSDTP